MQDSSGGRQSVWENRAAARLRQRLLPRGECGRPAGALRRRAARGVPRLQVGFPFCLSLFPYFFFFFKAVFSTPYYSHRLDCPERESGQEAFRGWDAPAHSAVSSETCPVMCAEPGVGRFGSPRLGEPGGASGEAGV